MSERDKPEVLRRSFEIKNKLGLHARAATVFIETIKNFDAAIRVTKDEQEVDGKSIIGLLMLAAVPGSLIDVSACGPDAEAALDAIAALIDRRFGEDS